MKLSITYFLLAILAKSGIPGASAACGDGMVVLGDSFSDTGNLFSLTKGAFPPAGPYIDGRFTNGKVWVEYLADLMGLDPPTPHYKDSSNGTNYAIGGAASGNSELVSWTATLTKKVTGPIPGKGLLVQTQDFLEDESSQCASEMLFVIWIGVNDFQLLGETDSKNVITNINESMEILIDVGATRFIVLNLPQLADSPANVDPESSLFLDVSLPSGLRNRVDEFNTGLAKSLKMTDKSNDSVSITHVDMAAFFHKVVSNPTEFGLDEANVGTPTLSERDLHLKGKLVFTNTQNAVWYDTVHPTTTFYKAIAEEVYSVVTGSKSTKSGKSGKAPKTTKSSKALKSSKAPKRSKAPKSSKAPNAPKGPKTGKSSKAPEITKNPKAGKTGKL